MNKKFEQTKTRKIPKEWEVAKLGDKNIVDLIMGQSPPSSTYNKKAEGLPFLQGKAEFGKIYPSPLIYCSRPLKIAEKNDLLLSVRAPVGDVNITPFKSCIGRGLTAIRPKSNRLHYLYLFYYLVFNKRIFQSLATGSTFKAIRKNEIENYSIPLPSLPEQKKIADILGTVDETIQKVDEAIGKTERLKKGLMQNLLTKGIGHKEFKNTDIGRIPKEWEVVKVIDLFKVETGTTPSTKKKEYWDGGLINWFTPTDLSKLEEDIYIEGSERKITEEAIKEVSITKLQKGSLILSTRAPVGYIAILKESATFNQGCKGLIPKDINFTNSEFYCYYLQNKKYKLQMESAGSTFKELSKERIENFKIPYISILEQKNISEILNKVNKRIELLKMNKQKFERIKKGLMNDLLTGRKRVKV